MLQVISEATDARNRALLIWLELLTLKLRLCQTIQDEESWTETAIQFARMPPTNQTFCFLFRMISTETV